MTLELLSNHDAAVLVRNYHMSLGRLDPPELDVYIDTYNVMCVEMGKLSFFAHLCRLYPELLFHSPLVSAPVVSVSPLTVVPEHLV